MILIREADFEKLEANADRLVTLPFAIPSGKSDEVARNARSRPKRRKSTVANLLSPCRSASRGQLPPHLFRTKDHPGFA